MAIYLDACLTGIVSTGPGKQIAHKFRFRRVAKVSRLLRPDNGKFGKVAAIALHVAGQ
jgi:hypothetical protein